jgi:uncharacterized protein
VKAFQASKVGRKGLDDGLILFIMADDRRQRIEVGYGLEGEVPDAMASRIINEIIVPRLQAGDRDGAVARWYECGCQRIGGWWAVGLAASSAQSAAAEEEHSTFGQLVVFGIVGILF